ncbi:MAG: hypothetical protein ABI342_01670 [Nitrososphaera sp.]
MTTNGDLSSYVSLIVGSGIGLFIALTVLIYSDYNHKTVSDFIKKQSEIDVEIRIDVANLLNSKLEVVISTLKRSLALYEKWSIETDLEKKKNFRKSMASEYNQCPKILNLQIGVLELMRIFGKDVAKHYQTVLRKISISVDEYQPDTDDLPSFALFVETCVNDCKSLKVVVESLILQESDFKKQSAHNETNVTKKEAIKYTNQIHDKTGFMTLDGKTMIQVNATIITGLLILLSLQSISSPIYDTVVINSLNRMVDDGIDYNKIHDLYNNYCLNPKNSTYTFLNSSDIKEMCKKLEIQKLEIDQHGQTLYKSLEAYSILKNNSITSNALFTIWGPYYAKIITILIIIPFVLSTLVEILRRRMSNESNPQEPSEYSLALFVIGLIALLIGITIIGILMWYTAPWQSLTVPKS